VKAVAFDLGGVLVDVDHARAARRLGVDTAAWERGWFTGDAHDRVSRGLIDRDAFVADVAARLAHAPDALADAWASVVEVWSGAAELVAHVEARGLRVLVWSNTDPIHADVMARALPHVADARALSFRLGAMKPEPQFYTRALAADGLRAEDVLFLDDRADNVAAARALGVRAEQILGGIADTRRIISAL
jgi:putative hydrolase of the HAD superfamily